MSLRVDQACFLPAIDFFLHEFQRLKIVVPAVRVGHDGFSFPWKGLASTKRYAVHGADLRAFVARSQRKTSSGTARPSRNPSKDQSRKHEKTKTRKECIFDLSYSSCFRVLVFS